MSKPKPARYRTTNWSDDNAALMKRGSLLAPLEGRPGRPAVFSDAARQSCLSIKVLFKLALRRTAGMVRSRLQLAGLDWPVPDCSTLCRRQKALKVQIPYRRSGWRLKLLVDTEPWRCQVRGPWRRASKSSAMASGKRGTMAFRADANGARSI